MKKKLFAVAIVAIAATAAGWNFNQSKNEVELSDLALANVEALARGEGADDACDDFTQRTCVSFVTGGGGGVYPDMYPSDAL